MIDLSFALSLVFGGCCSNVWTYEYLLRVDSKMGTALTFSQMAFVTTQALPSFLEFRSFRPRLRPRQVPLSQWTLQVLVMTAGSLLNNWAFAFSVPLTVQIVFRSGGLAVSMLLGRLFAGKQYTPPQIASVLFVTLGIILSTTSRSSAPTSSQPIDATQYTLGVVMLTASLLLTGVLGMLQEKTYTQYGPCWKEGLFYTHALSLPIALLFTHSIKDGFRSLQLASTTSPFLRPGPQTDDLSPLSLLPTLDWAFFTPYLILAGNLLTQLICVSGVNQLTSRVSSVSTNLVLTTRKAISLCFSVWWFGNGWDAQLGIGAGMVFLGSLLPSLKPQTAAKPVTGQRHKRE
ncbi:hypothetical protein PHLGIDRAFT_25068 [Phlebiopsis gigantea 11061_1 CR5-6]|uniref:UAA transporter n=1 Tax=Phlebiopsis gigantea (strain 11061_1 CR5-6) TaxID=745531 RepID=A0A0C3RVT3_PHLG1|nr:hypothetical protein PHLGIDRAFT_25068 [Phlebiopsis gigantea 11061_1 CR5-6]